MEKPSYCFGGCPPRLLLLHPRGSCKVKQGQSPGRGAACTKLGTKKKLKRAQMTRLGLKNPLCSLRTIKSVGGRRKNRSLNPICPTKTGLVAHAPFLEMRRGRICACKQRLCTCCLAGLSILREPIQNFLQLTLIRITACHHVGQ